MSNFFDHVELIWNSLKAGQAKTRAHFMISRDHLDNGDQIGSRFEAGQQYFQIVINEMFLANHQKWFADYDPMAFVASRFIYDKQFETLPLVVGPAMLEQFRQQDPRGMIFQNIPASGLNPYQGGSLTLVIIMNRILRRNNADKWLNFIENISGAVDPSTTFSIYLKVAKTVVGGFETLLGLQETIPVLGYRLTINPNIGQALEPTYFALIDEDSQQINRHKFWVRSSSLCYGDQLATAQPYQDNDFILFSITQSQERKDVSTLPFNSLWESTVNLALRPEAEYWQQGKAEFLVFSRDSC